ncbi:MAG TPA: right-handed parallel beta-helix repeat-containing protein, partial [Candidatus Limnocylindria bacterium]|nr:right-handed parallel beta-helix repeat-containing protein [Candidatus Limnocylindria bacterium]
MKTYPLHLGPLLVCLLLGSVVLPGQADSVEFHVSPTGNDANPGTADKPFATPERARDEWRHRRGENPSGATIWVHGGTYFRTNSLELGKLDSGTPNSPVTWQAAGGETPRFLGARRVTGFQPVTDRAVLSRFAKEAKSHVLQVKLSDLGITDFGEFKSRGYERPPAVAHGELFYRGKPMPLARWPNVGEFAAISGSPSPSARPDSEPMGSLEGGFNYEGDRPGRWKPADDIWVQGYWAQDWANSSERVQSLDPGSHLVKTAAPHGIFGFKKGQRFYFFNVLEELDRPGEWYIDRAGGILYFWPPDSTAPDRSPEILFSTLAETFVKLNEASHITLRGLTFDTARAHGISIVNGNGVRVTKCVIRNVGDTGVVVVGGTDNGVSDSDIFNCGDGGVSISGGDRKTLTPGRSFVENCHVANAGRWSKCFLPAIDLVGVGLRASHNLVHEHPHRGIQFAGNDMLVDYNEVHDVALETADVGAIYTGRDYSFRGN